MPQQIYLIDLIEYKHWFGYYRVKELEVSLEFFHFPIPKPRNRQEPNPPFNPTFIVEKISYVS